MPYRAPGMGGLVKDSLVVRSDGRVELDGKEIGWIGAMKISPVYSHLAGRAAPVERYEISFKIEVVPEKPEPDAVHDMAGRVIGHLKPDGTFLPLEEA